MANLNRVRAVWSGGGVTGPGVSTFYVRAPIAPNDFVGALDTFFTTCVVNMPNSVTVNVQRSGEVIDETSGELVELWSSSLAANPRSGTDAGVFAAGVGARIVWNTAGVTNGRRVRGSTYLVPLGAGQFQSDGTINNTSRTTYENAANTLRAALPGSLCIWTRAVGGAGGKSSDVVSATMPDRVSWLRSRRT